MSKSIICVGPSGSGKSTWARAHVEKDPNYLRINRDDLRNMRGKYWLPKQEKLITKWQKELADIAIKAGYSLVIDDTNLNPNTLQSWKEFFKARGVEVQKKDFTNVPMATCIQRDLKRPNSVGADVIKEQFRKYIDPPVVSEKPEFIEGAESVVISDIDGTTCLFGDKNPYERDFTKDEPNQPVLDLLAVMRKAGNKIIMFSGRMDKFEDQTRQWLKDHGVKFDALYMRKTGDNRKDVIIKQELYEAHIKGKYNVAMVIDDRLQVCKLWNSLNLPLFRVGDPESDF